MSRERWRAIPGLPGWKISTRGHVKSLPRRLADGRPHGGGPVPWQPDKDRYPRIWANGQWHSVARLVLTTFVRPPLPGEEACHWPDPTRANVRVENLRWGTRLQNEQDKKEYRELFGMGHLSSRQS